MSRGVNNDGSGRYCYEVRAGEKDDGSSRPCVERMGEKLDGSSNPSEPICDRASAAGVVGVNGFEGLELCDGGVPGRVEGAPSAERVAASASIFDYDSR